MQPLPYYICATAGLIELAKQRTEVIDGRQRAAFVVSRAIKGTRISAEIVDALRGYGLPILAFWITQGVAYYSTTVAGTTVLNGEPNGDGAAEIRALGPRCVPYSPERMSEPTLSAGRPSRSAGSKAATQASLAERPAMVRVNFDLAREQHVRLKIYAVREGRAVEDVLTEMIAQSGSRVPCPARGGVLPAVP